MASRSRSLPRALYCSGTLRACIINASQTTQRCRARAAPQQSIPRRILRGAGAHGARRCASMQREGREQRWDAASTPCHLIALMRSTTSQRIPRNHRAKRVLAGALEPCINARIGALGARKRVSISMAGNIWKMNHLAKAAQSTPQRHAYASLGTRRIKRRTILHSA